MTIFGEDRDFKKLNRLDEIIYWDPNTIDLSLCEKEKIPGMYIQREKSM